ncbi:MAG: helix-hairpin-helix domain-containing protein [Oligoflexia bacterium]|nr:helix-hairpin-helix domain-containing protein [Oligoflexia bacterium]
MDPNSRAIKLLEEIRWLLELKGENPFKIRAYDRAIAELSGHEDLPARAAAGTLRELPGIGAGISEVLTEFLLHDTSRARDELRELLPLGLLELTTVPGLGPKKAQVLIDKLGVRSVTELEKACREGRLLALKGFGGKLQQKLLKEIRFKAAGEGRQRLADALVAASALMAGLRSALPGCRIEETGELRRRCETLGRLEFLAELPPEKRAADALKKRAARWASKATGALPVELHFSRAENFGFELARTTASASHWKALGSPASANAATEEQFYENLELPWIPPEARESGEEIALARAGHLSRLPEWREIQGLFHCHTERSDGTASLEELALEAKRLGLRYLGISDHSRSAFYANGLSVEALREQRRELRRVQERVPEVRLFWGIESDILSDGSLDYEPAVLEKFDFVVASIHSRFGMGRDAMTERILRALRNPHTRFLGHPTGRLLLERQGYEIDLERIIAEAARHDVAIELNSHPARLDIDWRWGPVLRQRNAPVAVNPDAHSAASLGDARMGVLMARKALLPANQIVNIRSPEEVERWLKRR